MLNTLINYFQYDTSSPLVDRSDIRDHLKSMLKEVVLLQHVGIPYVVDSLMKQNQQQTSLTLSPANPLGPISPSSP